MRRIDVLVTLDALHKQPTSVYPWEVQILQHVHGEQSVVVRGESRCGDRVPDPEMEYIRLEKRYGFNKDTRVPRVVELFGAGAQGVQRLANAMREDLEEQARFDEQAAKAAELEAAKAADDTVAGAAVEDRRRQGGKRANAS